MRALQNPLKNSKVMLILRILPVIYIAVFAVLFLSSGKEFTVDGVLAFMPENFFLAAIVILGLFAVKSMSIVLPIIVLYIVSGALYGTFNALLLNIAGTALCFTIPYFAGYFSDTRFEEHIMRRNPHVKEYLDRQNYDGWFISYLLRIIRFLPGDVVSMYLGVKRIPYNKYITGSIAGALPSVISSTFIGDSINEPGSPVFIISVAVTVVFSVASLLVYKRIMKKRDKTKDVMYK